VRIGAQGPSNLSINIISHKYHVCLSDAIVITVEVAYYNYIASLDYYTPIIYMHGNDDNEL